MTTPAPVQTLELPDQWCDYGSIGAACGQADGSGVCKPRPSECNKDCPGVCGCDGTHYCNECLANMAGQDINASATCSP